MNPQLEDLARLRAHSLFISAAVRLWPEAVRRWARIFASPVWLQLRPRFLNPAASAGSGLLTAIATAVPEGSISSFHLLLPPDVVYCKSVENIETKAMYEGAKRLIQFWLLYETYARKHVNRRKDEKEEGKEAQLL